MFVVALIIDTIIQKLLYSHLSYIIYFPHYLLDFYFLLLFLLLFLKNKISKNHNLNVLVEYFSGKAYLGFSDIKSNHWNISNISKLFGSWKQKPEMILLFQGVVWYHWIKQIAAWSWAIVLEGRDFCI